MDDEGLCVRRSTDEGGAQQVMMTVVGVKIEIEVNSSVERVLWESHEVPTCGIFKVGFWGTATQNTEFSVVRGIEFDL